MKVSVNALRLLRLVDSRTTWKGDVRPGTELTCYFMPGVGDFNTYGAGDASSFKALERGGLIRPVRRTSQRYCYEITEDGIAELARHDEIPA